MLIKLTKAVVATAKGPTDGKSDYTLLNDVETKGFGLRTTRAGAKAYVLSYTTKSGISRRKTIGSASDLSLPKARQKARVLRQIVAEGGDPMGDLHELRAAPTVADLVERWREEAAPKLRPGTRTEYEGLIKLYIEPELGAKKVAATTQAEIKALHRQITQRGAPGRKRRRNTKPGAPISANRTVALLHKMFNIAIAEKMRTDNPAAVERNEEVGRERYLEGGELIRLMGALQASNVPQASINAVTILLATGARRSEVLGMRWDQISFERGVWSKPPSSVKQNKPHVVPLAASVQLLLSEIHAAASNGPDVYKPSSCPWVFPARTGQKPVADIKHAWATLRRAAALEGLRLHDLRHAYASFLVGGGQTLYMVGKLLGHSQQSTTQRYAHLAVDPMRAAADQVAARIEAAKGGKSAEVVPLVSAPAKAG